jgi:hypothetical protein
MNDLNKPIRSKLLTKFIQDNFLKEVTIKSITLSFKGVSFGTKYSHFKDSKLRIRRSFRVIDSTNKEHYIGLYISSPPKGQKLTRLEKYLLKL